MYGWVANCCHPPYKFVRNGSTLRNYIKSAISVEIDLYTISNVNPLGVFSETKLKD